MVFQKHHLTISGWCFASKHHPDLKPGGVSKSQVVSVIVSQKSWADAAVGVRRHHYLMTSSKSSIAMTTHKQVLQWVANIMFNSSHKLTKSIQTTLKTTALGLGGLEVALSNFSEVGTTCLPVQSLVFKCISF